MISKSTTAAVALLCLSGASAFVPGTTPVASFSSPTSSSSLKATVHEEVVTKATTTFLAATFILGNVAAIAPAFAMDDSSSDFGSSTQIIAKSRSGGRAGGRSSAARSSGSSSSSRSSTTVINRNTYVSPAPMYSSPTVIVAPPVYNPVPGIGLSLGLNAMSNIGNDMRDYRQEREIQDTRGELQQSKMREVEMEARLRQLENGQGNVSAQQNLQMMQQQQLFLQQQQAAAAAAAK